MKNLQIGDISAKDVGEAKNYNRGWDTNFNRIKGEKRMWQYIM